MLDELGMFYLGVALSLLVEFYLEWREVRPEGDDHDAQ
jgi:hypothetical protein